MTFRSALSAPLFLIFWSTLSAAQSAATAPVEATAPSSSASVAETPKAAEAAPLTPDVSAAPSDAPAPVEPAGAAVDNAGASAPPEATPVVEAPIVAAAPAATPVVEEAPAPKPSAPKLANWDEIGPGVLSGDLGAGVSYRNTWGTNYGTEGVDYGGFGWLEVEGTVGGLILNDLFLTQRWRIEEYFRLGVGLGARTNKVWFGVDYGAGIQGLFRISNVIDVGAKFYRAFFNDTNMAGVDKGTLAGVFVLSGHVRLGDLYLDYSRSFASGDYNAAPLRLNIVEARYAFDPKHGNGLRLRVDFATGDNGQPAPYKTEFTNLAARLSYVYAAY